MLRYLIYSLSLMLFWGVLFLEPKNTDWINPCIFLGMLYTYYSAYAMRAYVPKETKRLKAVKLIGPLIYVLVVLFSISQTMFFFLNPIYVATGLLIFTLFDQKQFPKQAGQFFVVSALFIYSFFLYDYWHKSQRSAHHNKYNFELVPNKSTAADSMPRSIPKLANYQFLNQDLDTIQLVNTEKHVIIETWNQRCPPCLRAMQEMPQFYKGLAEKADHYYVYVPARKNIRLDYQKVFSFDAIEDQEYIVVDQNLQEDANLSGYPNFLVFSPAGELVFEQHGYKAAKPLQEQINAVIP